MSERLKTNQETVCSWTSEADRQLDEKISDVSTLEKAHYFNDFSNTIKEQHRNSQRQLVRKAYELVQQMAERADASCSIAVQVIALYDVVRDLTALEEPHLLEMAERMRNGGSKEGEK